MAWNQQMGAYTAHYQQHHQQYCAGGAATSQHYGSYGNFYQQNVFSTNAWQV